MSVYRNVIDRGLTILSLSHLQTTCQDTPCRPLYSGHISSPKQAKRKKTMSETSKPAASTDSSPAAQPSVPAASPPPRVEPPPPPPAQPAGTLSEFQRLEPPQPPP